MAEQILVVDDDLEELMRIRTWLESAGLTGMFASDGLEALDQMRSVTPKLFILDVMMPRLDGFDVLRRLDRDPRTAQIPRIMLMPRTSEAHGSRRVLRHVDGYLTRPLAQQLTVEYARSLLGKSESVPDAWIVELGRKRVVGQREDVILVKDGKVFVAVAALERIGVSLASTNTRVTVQVGSRIVDIFMGSLGEATDFQGFAAAGNWAYLPALSLQYHNLYTVEIESGRRFVRLIPIWPQSWASPS